MPSHVARKMKAPNTSVAQQVASHYEEGMSLELNAITLLENLLKEGFDSRPYVPFRDYCDRPVEFAEEVIGVALTPQQQEILRSVVQNQVTNVQSAVSLGKSFVSSILVLYWVYAVGGLCVSTAPTEGQLKEILWSEIRKAHSSAIQPLPGQCRTLSIKFTEWSRAYGFVSANYDSNAFQGKHGQKLLLIMEEACGISREIDDAAEACVTGAENRLLRIGNPVKDGTPFAEACARSAIILPAWPHPNVSWAYQVAPDGIHRLKQEVWEEIAHPSYHAYYEAAGKGNGGRDLLPSNLDLNPIIPAHQWPEYFPQDAIPGAISISWIERQRVARGELSVFWQNRIEGLFSEDSDSSLVPRPWFRSARQRYDDNPQHWQSLAKVHNPRYGLDVGDGGDDHAIAQWNGPVLMLVDEKATINDRLDVERAAKWGWDFLRRQDGSIIAVDRIGVGAGTLANILTRIHQLDTHQQHQYRAKGYTAGKGKDVSGEYANRISQDLWKLREAFRLGTIAIAPLTATIESRLEEELARTQWSVTSTDQIAIEPKQKTRDRLKRSPDRRDAVAMGFSISSARTRAEEQSQFSVGPKRQSAQRFEDPPY